MDRDWSRGIGPTAADPAISKEGEKFLHHDHDHAVCPWWAEGEGRGTVLRGGCGGHCARATGARAGGLMDVERESGME